MYNFQNYESLPEFMIMNSMIHTFQCNKHLLTIISLYFKILKSDANAEQTTTTTTKQIPKTNKQYSVEFVYK